MTTEIVIECEALLQRYGEVTAPITQGGAPPESLHARARRHLLAAPCPLVDRFVT